MDDLEEQVRREVVELHDFFVDWFNGTIDRDQLQDGFIAHMHPDFIFLTPDGIERSRDDLVTGFKAAHGGNPAFRIQVRDVKVRHDLGDQVVATYTEWQKGSQTTAVPNTARITTVVMTKDQPPRWLLAQETWLPDAIRDADPFDF